MVSSVSKLEELKKQVRDTTNQQYQLQAQKKKLREAVTDREEEIKQNEQEMIQLVRSVFGQSELAAAKERELVEDAIERFSHRQSVMNEQLITLNDNLTDITSLKAVYEAKRDQLEIDYENQKNALQGQIDGLEERLNSLNEDIKKESDELDSLIKQKRLKTFAYKIGSAAMVIALIIVVILVIEWLGSGISAFFGGISTWFEGLFG